MLVDCRKSCWMYIIDTRARREDGSSVLDFERWKRTRICSLSLLCGEFLRDGLNLEVAVALTRGVVFPAR